MRLVDPVEELGRAGPWAPELAVRRAPRSSGADDIEGFGCVLVDAAGDADVRQGLGLRRFRDTAGCEELVPGLCMDPGDALGVVDPLVSLAVQLHDVRDRCQSWSRRRTITASAHPQRHDVLFQLLRPEVLRHEVRGVVKTWNLQQAEIIEPNLIL